MMGRKLPKGLRIGSVSGSGRLFSDSTLDGAGMAQLDSTTRVEYLTAGTGEDDGYSDDRHAAHAKVPVE